MSSSSPPPTPSTPAPIPDSTTPSDLPLTSDMTASVVLTSLPLDAASALASAGTFPTPKITVRFRPIGSAPALRQSVCKISSTQRFETVVTYLRKKLNVGETESVFLYVNSAFAPSLDEVVGNLHRCFRNQADDALTIAYSMTPAFG